MTLRDCQTDFAGKPDRFWVKFDNIGFSSVFIARTVAIRTLAFWCHHDHYLLIWQTGMIEGCHSTMLNAMQPPLDWQKLKVECEKVDGK